MAKSILGCLMLPKLKLINWWVCQGDSKIKSSNDGLDSNKNQEEAFVAERLQSVQDAFCSAQDEPQSPPSIVCDELQSPPTTPRSTIKSPYLECPSTPLVK